MKQLAYVLGLVAALTLAACGGSSSSGNSSVGGGNATGEVSFGSNASDAVPKTALTLTIPALCRETRTRLLLTTRVQTLPEGFARVENHVTLTVDVPQRQDFSGTHRRALGTVGIMAIGTREPATRQKDDKAYAGTVEGPGGFY